MAAGVGMEPIDWHAPWLAPWRGAGERVGEAWGNSWGGAMGEALGQGLTLADALNCEPGAAVRFVAQSALPAGAAYERYVFETGQCPTRDNLHDFFNGLCWLRFPETKRKLNQLQAAQIEAQGIGAVRGAVRDALTLFDENAAFFQAPASLWEALLAKDWQELFIGLRSQWQEARLVVFGHAALEKLVHPRKAITVHVYRMQLDSDMNSIARLDEEVAHSLSAAKLGGKPFAPLPVLGVPGWWRNNEDFSFYDDASVFRPRRAP